MNKKILFIAIILIVLCSFSAVSASEINSTDENGGSDSELLSLPSTSTDTVSMLSNSNVNFTKLNETIANADDSVSLDSDVNLDVNESNFFKDGIIINKTLTIDGNGYTINATCVDGTQARIFNVVNNATLTLKNMDITGAYYSGNGGAIYVDSYSNLILENVIVNENIATTNGGAIYLKSNANLTATDVIFKNNLASNGNTRGGALYAYKNTNVKLVNATFENNTVKGELDSSTFGTYGGQIFLHSDSNMEIINSSFINTLVMVPFSLNGGVIYLESNSHLTISNSLFENITLKYDRDGSRYYTYSNAGGIINCGGNTVLNITDTVFKDNNNINDGHSYAYGYGLIYSTSSSSQNYITNCIFINNTADRVSAIRTRNADIVSCIFVDNSVNNDYPEIYYEGNGKGTISHNVFLDNATSIRILNSAANVVEADNWWGTNNPGQFVRIQDSYQVPNNYVVMSVYNEGNTVYATLTRDSSGDFIENPELLPIRTAIFEASATTTLNTTDAMASTVVDDSEVNVTIDGETVTHVMAQGNITSIEIASIENTSAGADGTINFVLTGDNGSVDGELTVMVNDKKYTAQVSNGLASINLGKDYLPDVYDIYYIYEGGDNYAAIPTKTKAEEQFEVYKNDVTITFTRDKNIITFNVAGDNGIVPTGTINVTVGDINKIFTLSNGAASYNYGNDLGPDTYDVNVTYSGDIYNNEGNLISTFDIIKYAVDITFTNVANTLTFNVAGVNDVVPTGQIIVTLGNVTQTFTLKNGVASYDFGKFLSAGNYNLTVNYTGDDYYNPKIMEDTYEIVKMTPTIELTVQNADFKCGNGATIFVHVVGDENIATGYVYLYSNDYSQRMRLYGSGEFSYGGYGYYFDPGYYNLSLYYEGDGYYDPTNYTYNGTLTAHPYIEIEVPNEVFSDKVPVSLSFDGKILKGTMIVKMDGVEVFDDEIESDSLTLLLTNVEAGEHTFEAFFVGNDECPSGEGSYTTDISYPELPQWSQAGYDYTNSGQSPYVRINDVVELWNYTGDGNSLRGTPLIDKDGNIIVTFGNKFITLSNDGTLIKSKSGSVPGYALDYRGILITPKSGNRLEFVSSGDEIYIEVYGDLYPLSEINNAVNMWMDSSSYAAVIGPDGSLYVTTQYDYGGWVSIVKWEENYMGFEFYTDTNMIVPISGISYGSQPNIAPVTLDNLGNLWHTSTSGLRGVVISSNTIGFYDSDIGTRGRAVVDANDIAYVFGNDDKIYAVTMSGILWNTTVTGGAGSTMVVGKDSEYILSVNSEGVLYKYDVTDGKETKIYDFENPVSSALMTDANGVIYVGDDDGMFWALTDNGTVLWKFDAGSAIVGLPSMDKNGVIYIYTADNVLYALGNHKNASTISLEVGDTTTVDGLTAIATVNEDATGEVIFTLNGADSYKVKIVNGTATLFLEKILAGDYNITATYEGNYAYFGNETSSSFTVTKVNSTIEIAVPIIYVDTNGTINITIENATGDVLVQVTGLEDKVIALNEGIATYTLPLLEEGKYNIAVIYDGDAKYFNSTATSEFEVVKYDAELSLTIDDSVITVSINDNATGNVIVTIGDISFVKDAQNLAPIDAANYLNKGTYPVTVNYAGDDIFAGENLNGTVTVKAATIIVAPDVSVAYKDPNGEFVATVINQQGKPLVVNVDVIFNGEEYALRTDSNGRISIPIGNLTPGKYAAEISFKGSKNYRAANASALVTVTKSSTVISAPDVSVAYKDPTAELVATITNEHGKPLAVNLNVNFNGKDYTLRTDSDGRISLPIGNLTPGNYSATISYKGSSNYRASSTTALVTVTKSGTVIVAPDVSIEYKDSTGELVATITNEHGKPLVVNLNVNLNGKDYTVRTDSDGRMSLPIGTLASGNHVATISYKGSKNYEASSATAKVVVNKAATVISAQDVSIAYKDSGAELVATIVSEHNNKALIVDVTVNLNGKNYVVRTDSNGCLSIPIDTLSPGNYTATIIFKGSKNYAASTTTAQVVVRKAATTLSAQDVSIAYKDPNGALVATIVSEHGKTLDVSLNVNLNGKDYTLRTGSDGTMSLPIDTLTPGNYTATISYKGSKNYEASSVTAQVTVTKSDTMISAQDVTVASADSAGALVATVTNQHGKTLVVNVKVNLDGKTTTVKTDSNGQISVPNNELKPGTYDATISYNGSGNYNGSTATARITVI